MYCNESIHYALNEDHYVQCPFCYKQIQNSNPIKSTCCNKMDITNNDSCLICKNCASVHGYQPAKEYVDFHEKKHLIKKNQFRTVNIIYKIKL